MISVYVHIPFCENICTYCDFCKFYKNDEWINQYLDALEKEINSLYKGEIVKTLYIGGGTPSCLNIEELSKLFDILNALKLSDECEITFEANSTDLTEEKLLFLSNKVNRLSIGIQTFNAKYLSVLGRNVNVDNVKLAKKYFNNINIDLMYNFSLQTISELEEDILKILSLDVTHISTYSLIVEPHTKLFISGYEVFDDDTLDKYVDEILAFNGYNHYEISNYAKEGYESKHNLTYWNNEEYYGFGLGSGGYIDGFRYENTRNLSEYLKDNYVLENHELSLNERIQNEFILGLRKIDGINKKVFLKKYGFDIKNIVILNELLDKKMLLENDGFVYINPKYLYISNEILIKFLSDDLLKH